MKGIFGSERYLGLVAVERMKLDALLARDPLRLRRLVPRRGRQLLYDRRLTRERRQPPSAALEITLDDFRLGADRARAGLGRSGCGPRARGAVDPRQARGGGEADC